MVLTTLVQSAKALNWSNIALFKLDELRTPIRPDSASVVGGDFGDSKQTLVVEYFSGHCFGNRGLLGAHINEGFSQREILSADSLMNSSTSLLP